MSSGELPPSDDEAVVSWLKVDGCFATRYLPYCDWLFFFGIGPFLIEKNCLETNRVV